MTPQDRRWTVEMIRQEIKILLTAQTGVLNDSVSETIDNLYPGVGSLFGKPVMHPYGFTSRATPGTIQMVGKVGDHPGARVILGHLDKEPPKLDLVGESVMYDAYGHEVRLSALKIQVGSKSSDEPQVLGNVLKSFLTALVAQVDFIFDHLISGDVATVTSAGNPTAPGPVAPLAVIQKALLATQKAQYLTVPLTNIVSLKVFSER